MIDAFRQSTNCSQAAAAEVHGKKGGKGGKKGAAGGEGSRGIEEPTGRGGGKKGRGRGDSGEREEPQARQETHGRQDDSGRGQAHGGADEHDWNSVASCYMLHGEDIRNVPWDGDAQSEIDAFVSEELWVPPIVHRSSGDPRLQTADCSEYVLTISPGTSTRSYVSPMTRRQGI